MRTDVDQKKGESALEERRRYLISLRANCILRKHVILHAL